MTVAPDRRGLDLGCGVVVLLLPCAVRQGAVYRNALSPVMSRPTMSSWMSAVPS